MVGILVGEEFQVNTTTVEDQNEPSVAIDAQGNYVVVWTSIDPDSVNNNIFAQRYDRFGTAIGGELAVVADPEFGGVDSVVGMDAEGNFVVAWTGNDNDFGGIQARRFDRDGNALGDAFLVNTETESNQSESGIAMNANGQFVVTWESFRQDGDSLGIFAQMYDRDGNPVGDEIAVNNITNGTQDDPVVAIDGSGNFVIAWEDSSTGIETVNARRFDSSGTPIGDSFVVSTTASIIDHRNPDIAMNANGEFIIAWQSLKEIDGDRNEIFAQRYSSAGERIGDEIAVNTTTADDQREPSVAIDAEGNFLITWESDEQDGSGEGVFGQYFDNTGTKQGNEFQINTFTEGRQDDVAVAMTPDGNAVVVWESNDQDGEGEGIFAQQLAVPSLVEFSQPTFTLNEDGTVVGAEVTLTRDNDIIESEVQVSVTGGTATAGLDFTDTFPLTVTFAPGETTQTLSIPVLQDNLEEGTETLELNLTATNNAEIGTQSSATVNIIETPNLRLRGSRNDDRLRGGDGNDTIFGFAGNDKLKGLSGDDILFGGSGNDRLIGGSGDDRLFGNHGSDRLVGQSGDDILVGGKGGDRLKGGAGRDFLIGDRGNDILIGGVDRDTFFLKSGHGTDLIRDFNIEEDVIRLRGSLSFEDLSLRQQGRSTVIKAGGEILATLRNVQADQLNQASFIHPEPFSVQ